MNPGSLPAGNLGCSIAAVVGHHMDLIRRIHLDHQSPDRPRKHARFIAG
jgi:hypothetical protein